MTAPTPSAPRGFGPAGKRFWHVYQGCALDEHITTLVVLGAQTVDRLEGAQAEIRRLGYGPAPKGCPNPYTVERDARRDLLKIVRTLGTHLDIAAPKEEPWRSVRAIRGGAR
jgi:hypothetical protein